MSWLFRELNHSELYFKYRPRHPDDVYDLICRKLDQSLAGKFAGETKMAAGEPGPASNPKREVAVDAGCGPGFGTIPLMKFFKKVIGIDCSESQISVAKKNYSTVDSNKLMFATCDVCNFSRLVGESKVDLVLAAQALHWFNRPEFYAECKKALKPGGLLAAFGYGTHHLENEEADKVIGEHILGTLDDYYDPKAKLLEVNYDTIFPEFCEHFSESSRDDSLVLRVESRLDDYIGYLSSWSHYRKYRLMNPDKDDPLCIVHNKLRVIFHEDNPLIKRRANIFILFGRNS